MIVVTDAMDSGLMVGDVPGNAPSGGLACWVGKVGMRQMHRAPYAFVETLFLAPAMRAACFFWAKGRGGTRAGPSFRVV